jgi:hypothetical protein
MPRVTRSATSSSAQRAQSDRVSLSTTFDVGRRFAADSTQRRRRHSLPQVGVRSAAQSRHLTDLAECPLRSVTIRTLFGRGTSRGCTPHPMTLHALPKRTVTAPVGCSAARHGQSDQCTPAWDSRCLCHSSDEPAQQAPGGDTPAASFHGEHCGSPQFSTPAQRVVPATLTASWFTL